MGLLVRNLAIQVVEANRFSTAVGHGCYHHNTGIERRGARLEEKGFKEAEQQEMTKMVDSEGRFEMLFSVVEGFWIYT